MSLPFHRNLTAAGRRTLTAAAFLFASSASALAQGTDDCSTATPIAGFGTFPVSTVGATDSPQQFGSCGTVHRDVWFAWTAPATGGAAIGTCGGTTADTQLAVYSGGACPTAGALLRCSDDDCGTQSTVTINVVAGSTYLIQVGAFSAGTSYTGTIFVSSALPPPPCGVNTGPDVIVGQLTDVMNVAPVGGIDAIAIGTTSCNIGTSVLVWVAGTPAHPVIRQNLYRFKVVNGAGRFEQIGMSWLKHAFAAGAGSLCCACQSGAGGGLGVGCSDTYTAGLNGSQSNAGPNWQVNAHTGAFPYPPANPTWSGAIARRCEVALTDLEVTGAPGAARFFGEGHYVTADDALAGNQNNNASWIEMGCTGTAANYDLSFAGATNEASSAIHAWALAESGVTLHDVQIPGDGLVVVGSKATNLGGGTWHYEYAVYNMNADRNVGTFSIPVPAGVAVTNIGFHDVAHHDGDGNASIDYSGVDWIGTLGGGAVAWSCEAQPVNDNANAIRWGSLYNFRFDANAAPINGAITLGVWKPGSPTSMTTNGDVPGAGTITNFCAGDGTSTPCPCANNGSTGRGCASSSFANGALLTGAGVASVATDSVQLTASDMTGSSCVFFQGDAQVPPVVVDDGLGCVTGSVVRLGTKPIGGAVAQFPAAGDPLLSVRGAIPGAGGTRYYQCFYRNAATSFCPPATSNRTNGVVIAWAP